MTRETTLMLIASFLIAVGTRASLESTFTTNNLLFDAKLEYRGLPDTLTVVGEPFTVSVIASGSQEYLDRLDRGKVTVVVDLTHAKTGTWNYPLTINAPSTSRLTFKTRYSKVLLDVQQMSSISQPVRVEPSGLIPRGYLFDGASVLPEKVTIVGPVSVLPRVRQARVVLELTQVRPGGSFLLPVEILDEANRPVPYVKAQPAEVSVSPAVTAAPASRLLLVDPSWTGQPAFGYKVIGYELKPSQVRVEGDSASMSHVTTIETEPITLDGLKANFETDVKLKLPEGIKTRDKDVVHVSVKIGPQTPPETTGH